MNTAFFVVFALFIVAMVGLAVTAVRWGVRRDRVARAERTDLSGPDPQP
jgi:hypothetical protein